MVARSLSSPTPAMLVFRQQSLFVKTDLTGVFCSSAAYLKELFLTFPHVAEELEQNSELFASLTRAPMKRLRS